MKKTTFSLILLLTATFSYGQDQASILSPSLRMLNDLPAAQNPLSCFDYNLPRPLNISRTTRGPGCTETFTPVQVGKFRRSNRTGYRNGDYVISRPAANKYQAILNLRFVPATPGTGHGVGTPQLAAQLLQRTKNCLEEMKPYLKGPNREDFEIKIVSGNDQMPEGMPKPDPIEIKVSEQAADYRGDAGNFGSNFQCVTIGHEILHHLGLCDEYHEGVIVDHQNRQFDWGCRPVTAATSYMRNMRYAFDTIVPQTSRCVCDSNCQKIMEAGGVAKEIFLSMNASNILDTESSLVAEDTAVNPNRQVCRRGPTQPMDYGTAPTKAFELDSETGNVYKFNSYRVFAGEGGIYYDKVQYTCTCGPQHKHCAKMMDQIKAKAAQNPKRVSCPDGLRPKSAGPSIGSDPSGSRLDECSGEGDAKVCDLVITTPDSGKSLLAPSHFYKMIAGDCRGGSPNYERCEQYAYMPKTSNQCAQMPPECLNDDYYLNGPQGPVAAPASNQ